MLTGHDYLQQHLNSISAKTSASCPLSGDSTNGRYLLICSKLKDVIGYTERCTGDAFHFSLCHWTARQCIADWA
ncbi:hypothetical protein CEXT_418981 [Caerostris extrusa]|uniref:Uncharacterized protein n=1 Tax=Caerostris extrusa TaxID=172846 RepID=A0AAV4PCQ5_CAEEX|nr:hypothetical protein CEXT_418981 [Caerostris extrusa]